MTTTLQRIRIGALSLVLVVVVSIAVYRLSGYDWLEAAWLVVVTISTVGFAEHSDLPPALQVFTICVILLGVSSGVYTCGGFIQMALEGEINRLLGKRKMTKEISRLSDHVVICGFGRLGSDLAERLTHRSIPYVVVDLDLQRTILASDRSIPVIQGDATSEEVLEQANLKTARALVTTLPSDAQNVFITLTARNMRPDIQIIAKSDQESTCRKLRQAGANRIVMPHQVGAHQMELMISRPSTANLFKLFSEASYEEMELDEFRVTSDCELVGKTLGEWRIREDFNLLLVGIYGSDEEALFNPPPDQIIQNGDTLLVMGKMTDISRLKQFLTV